MFGQMESIRDQIRHFLLNPPLAPGGGNSSPSSEDDPLILRYLPILVLLTMFWPVLLTLLAASFSASAWLFWLCVGAAGALLQLLYVLYNFMMIVWDLSALTLLKTFAMLRSFIRYYFFKMTDATGIEFKGRKNKHSKKRRRKEWREEVDRATSYGEYCQIELFEPQQQQSKTKGAKVAPGKPRLIRRTVSVPGSEKESSPAKSSRFSGLRWRKRNTVTESVPPQPQSPCSPMRKIHSTNELKKKSGSRRGNPFRNTVSGSDTDKRYPLRRVSSSFFPRDSDGEEDESRDESCPKWQQVVKEDLGMPGSMLLTTLSRLKEARMQASTMKNPNNHDLKDANNDEETDASVDDIRGQSFHITSFTSRSETKQTTRPHNEDYSSSLKTLLSGIVKRNHLSVDDFLMQDARSIVERGQHSLKRETRDAIDRYGEEVERCMDWVASGAVYLGGTTDGGDGDDDDDDVPAKTMPERIMQKQHEELSKRYTLFRRMKQNMGHTALMLSGGGAQAMYHLGTIKALVEGELWEHIHVISGTSGGSIAAAMCAIKTPDELIRDICVNTVSTDYMLNGTMKKQGVSWFPELYKMGANWLKDGLVMDSKDFSRCCEFYYSNITFEEAYEMTGKHVCITVSASRASSGSGVQRLLLNHISTPNVTLASAVAASCAVPGVMAPAKLMMKDSRGKSVPFEVDGVEWIDGSVQADLPFKRISTLFNISNFVVAQTNFHVVPFLNKAHHPNINTLYWKMFQMCMWDVKSRVLNLSQLGLFPKIFGQDLSKMFKQKYYGKLTLVPRFTTLQLFGLKVLSNPTVADMDVYLQNGQLAAWPFLRVLQEMLRIERSIDTGLAKLKQRLESIESGYNFASPIDDANSISSSVGATYRAHLPGLGREAELLKEQVRDLKTENKQLRQQVMRLQRSLGISQHAVGDNTLEGRLVSVSTVEEDDMLHSEEKKVSRG